MRVATDHRVDPTGARSERSALNYLASTVRAIAARGVDQRLAVCVRAMDSGRELPRDDESNRVERSPSNESGRCCDGKCSKNPGIIKLESTRDARFANENLSIYQVLARQNKKVSQAITYPFECVMQQRPFLPAGLNAARKRGRPISGCPRGANWHPRRLGRRGEVNPQLLRRAFIALLGPQLLTEFTLYRHGVL